MLRRLHMTEPVRLYLYTVLVALVVLAVAYGYVTSDRAPLVLAFLAALLGVPGTEAARARVTPTGVPRAVPDQLEA